MAAAVIKRYEKKIASLTAASKRARSKAGEATENIMGAATTAGVATLFGSLRGKYGGDIMKVGGIPTDLMTAGILHSLALLGVGRGMEQHLRNAGNGALSAAGFVWGAKMGMASLVPKPTIPGLTPGTPAATLEGERLSAEALANLVAS